MEKDVLNQQLMSLKEDFSQLATHLVDASGYLQDSGVLPSQELIEEIPDFNRARHMLAVSLQNLGRFPEAKEHFLQLNRRAIFSRYEEVVREVAANRNALLLDLTPHFTAVTDSSLYLDDMHPSEAGHELIARRLFETLTTR